MPLSTSDGESFTLTSATKCERNILARLRQSNATKQLFHELWRERAAIEQVVAHHLRLDKDSSCQVQGTNTWLMGQFNVCIIVHVCRDGAMTSKMVFRFPVPHKVGEQHSPGAMDGKLRAEVATYAWIEANCPEVPIPGLRGFGLSPSLQVTSRDYARRYSVHR